MTPRPGSLGLLLDRRVERLVVGRVDGDAAHADALAELLDVDWWALGAVRVQPRAGVALVTGHRRGAVVEDHDHALDLVVDGVDERRDSGVEEGRVADDADRGLAPERLVEAGHHADARAHAEAAVEREQRRQRAERVAADVAHRREAALAQRGVDGAVGAAGTEHGRPDRQAGRRLRRRRDPGRRRHDRAPAPRRLAQHERLERAEDELLVELAVGRDGGLADHRQAQRAHLLLDERVELLDHGDTRDVVVQARDLGVGQRVRHAELEEPGLGKRLARIRVGDARGDDAEVRGARFQHVERALLRAPAQLLQALEHEPVTLPRVLRDHDVLADVPRVVARLHGDRHARQHLPAAVRDARRRAQHDRRVELLREREGLGDEVVGLLAVGGLEHRDSWRTWRSCGCPARSATSACRGRRR